MTPRLIRGARTVAFVCASLIIVLGPPSRLVVDEPWNPMRMWAMFGKNGMGVCKVRYAERTAAGDRALDRLALLGFEDPADAPLRLREVTVEEVEANGRALCAALRSSGHARPDVRVEARCATRSGWRRKYNQELNLCAVQGRAR